MTKDCKEVFTDIYARKAWGDGSGGGSAPDTARPYCELVSCAVIGATSSGSALTVLDIGCGDGVVSKGINWLNATYIGVDAAQGFDALTDPLPAADLVLCKEVMQHLSNAQVQLLLDRTAHYPVRLFTNSTYAMPERPVNCDIETGDFRPVDLSLPPFNQDCDTVLTYGHWHVQRLTSAR